MKATVVDLRYRMNDVLKALDRREDVGVLYRGTLKGIISPVNSSSHSRVRDHVFFGMKKLSEPVAKIMDDLRGGRNRDL